MGRIAGDAMGHAVHERPELVGRQGTVHPTPRLRGASIDVVAPEDHLEGAAAPDQARQPDGATATGEDPERHLGLAEHRPWVLAVRQRREAHVEAERQFAPSATDAPFDHGDRGLGHRAEGLAHLVIRVQLGRRRRVDGEREDRRHIEMGDEELGVRAANHDDTNLRIRPELLRERGHVQEQFDREQVDRRTVDRDGGDAVVHVHRQPGDALVAHGRRRQTNSRRTARVRSFSSGLPANTPALRSVTPSDAIASS